MLVSGSRFQSRTNHFDGVQKSQINALALSPLHHINKGRKKICSMMVATANSNNAAQVRQPNLMKALDKVTGLKTDAFDLRYSL